MLAAVTAATGQSGACIKLGGIMRSVARKPVVGVIAGAAIIAVFSGIGGATAASLITSKQIKDGTIASVDVKDATLKVGDLSSSARSTLSQPGPAGTQGEQGPVGPMGPQGVAGLVGPLGATGAEGAPGLKGDIGAIGPVGAQGDNGLIGATGPAGPKGDTGITGSQGPQGPSGGQGPQGPAGISNVTTLAISPGASITPSGTVLGQMTLNKQNSYLVTASVTAVAGGNDSMQCQLSSSLSSTWDDMGEMDLTQRATVPLEHAYPRLNTVGTYTVFVACLSASATYVVDTAHLYAWQVGSVAGSGGPVISFAPQRKLSWAPMN